MLNSLQRDVLLNHKLKSYEYEAFVTFISFVYENIVKIKEQYPEAKCEFLFDNPEDAPIEKLLRDGFNVDIWEKSLTRELVEEYHKAGITVNCWTVNDKERGEELASFGVDYITTNILE